jgi:hypothetical protein
MFCWPLLSNTNLDRSAPSGFGDFYQIFRIPGETDRVASSKMGLREMDFPWRAFDRLCGCSATAGLSIFDRIFGLSYRQPPTCEADHERLARAFPAPSEAIQLVKYHAQQNRDGDLGSPYP